MPKSKAAKLRKIKRTRIKRLLKRKEVPEETVIRAPLGQVQWMTIRNPVD